MAFYRELRSFRRTIGNSNLQAKLAQARSGIQKTAREQQPRDHAGVVQRAPVGGGNKNRGEFASSLLRCGTWRR